MFRSVFVCLIIVDCMFNCFVVLMYIIVVLFVGFMGCDSVVNVLFDVFKMGVLLLELLYYV